MIRRQLCEQREERRGFGIGRGNAHQPGERNAAGAHRVEKRGEISQRTAPLLRLVADIDLHEAGHALSRLVHRLGERGEQARPVERMDHVEQRDGFFGLVRLQLADQVERDIRIVSAQGPPFALRLLHPVLAEHALAGGDQGDNRGRIAGLADRYQRDVLGIAPRRLAHPGDVGVDVGEAGGGCIIHGAAL